MMLYWALDPPSHSWAASQLLHPQSSLGNNVEQDHDSSTSAVKIYNHAAPLIRPWRWRITAITAISGTILLLSMMSALADPLPSGFERSVPDPADKPAEESEFSTACPSAPNNTKKRQELVLRSSNDSRDQPQFRNRGLMSMNKLQPVLNFDDSQQVGTEPRANRHRQRAVGTGRLTSSSDRRILISSACTNKDISIFQSPDGSSGIPRYAVQIMNNCMSDCPPSDIHVFCGWFASALLVNPNSFKRIAFNDCLVNGGKPLRHGETLRFTYANSFMYPIRFKSASFCK